MYVRDANAVRAALALTPEYLWATGNDLDLKDMQVGDGDGQRAAAAASRPPRQCQAAPPLATNSALAVLVQVPLGRRFRALKLFFTLRMFGAEGLRAHLRRT